MNNYRHAKYGKSILVNILEHIYDDDYFYNKKGSWEDWVIMRADVNDALVRYNINSIKNLDSSVFYSILEILNK